MKNTMILIGCLFTFGAYSQPSKPSTRTSRKFEPVHQTSKSAVGVDLIQGSKKGIVVYPNPANDHIIVSMPADANSARHIRLLNNVGQPVLQVNSARELTYLLDVARLPKGMYLLEVLTDGVPHRTRWVKN